MPELSVGGSEQIELDQVFCSWRERERGGSLRGYIIITSKGEEAYLKFYSKSEEISVQLKKEFDSVRCYQLWLEVILKNGSRINITPKDNKLIKTVAQAISTSAKETKFHAVLGENIQTLNKKRPPTLEPMLVNLKADIDANKTFAKSLKVASNNFESKLFGNSSNSNSSINSTEQRLHKIKCVQANVCAEVGDRQNESIDSISSETANENNNFDVPHGFPNRGTNCYVNSVLQCLFSMPQFIKPLQVVKEDNCSKLLEELQKLLEWRTRGTELCAFEIISNIKRLVGFDLKNQEDAHEFLVSLFKHMGLDENKADGPMWFKNVQDCFEITIEQVTRCLNCRAESVKYNTQNEILLASLGKGTKLPVQSYLHQYFEPSTVEFTCSACYHKWAELSLRIKKPPRILVLLLPRYNDVEVTLADISIGNFLSDETNKIGKFKRIYQLSDDQEEPQKKMRKEESEMDKCLVDSNGRKEMLSKTESRSNISLISQSSDENVLGRVEKKENCNIEKLLDESGKRQSSVHYKFVGSVSRIGKDNTSGHYVSDCLHLASQFPPKWFSFNDMAVVETNLKQIAFLRSQRAYILFYMSEKEFYSCLDGAS